VTVTVFSKNKCVQCDATKAYLKDKGIPFEIVDLATNPEAYDTLIEAGFQAAPVVFAGDESWAGFRPDRLDALAAQTL
jgi:glutaredoxin-like protein NrdH